MERACDFDFEDQDIGEEGCINSMPALQSKNHAPFVCKFYCNECFTYFESAEGTTKCETCDSEFIHQVEDDSDDEENDRDATGYRTVFRIGGDDRESNILIFGSGDDDDFGRFRRVSLFRRLVPEEADHRSIFSNRLSGRFNSNRPQRIDLSHIFEDLLQQMSLNQQSSQQPAAKDTLKNLRVIKIKDKHYEENKAGELEPPSCTICTSEMKKTAAKLRCSHIFHKKCIQKWLSIHHVCPICREEVD